MPDELYQEYLNELAAQHEKSAMMENSSTKALLIAYQSNNGDEIKSITAAMMCLGGMHAPIKQCWEFLRSSERRDVYPGFGNSFEKGFPKRFTALWNLATELRFEELDQSVEKLVKFVREDTKKDIYPNLGFYTALAFVDTHYRDGIGFLIKSRIDAWNEIMKRLEYKRKHV